MLTVLLLAGFALAAALANEKVRQSDRATRARQRRVDDGASMRWENLFERAVSVVLWSCFIILVIVALVELVVG